MLQKLSDSMPRRLQMVIDANGEAINIRNDLPHTSVAERTSVSVKTLSEHSQVLYIYHNASLIFVISMCSYLMYRA